VELWRTRHVYVFWRQSWDLLESRHTGSQPTPSTIQAIAQRNLKFPSPVIVDSKVNSESKSPKAFRSRIKRVNFSNCFLLQLPLRVYRHKILSRLRQGWASQGDQKEILVSTSYGAFFRRTEHPRTATANDDPCNECSALTRAVPWTSDDSICGWATILYRPYGNNFVRFWQ